MTNEEQAKKIVQLEEELRRLNSLYVDEMVRRSEIEVRCTKLHTAIEVITNLGAFK